MTGEQMDLEDQRQEIYELARDIFVSRPYETLNFCVERATVFVLGSRDLVARRHAFHVRAMRQGRVFEIHGSC